MIFKVGDRVWYVSDIYLSSKENPLKGSQYECMGTVATTDEEYGTCTVDWDNFTYNSYFFTDLMLAKHRTPEWEI